MFKVFYESKSDGSKQEYRISANSIPEAMRNFERIFPDVKILNCVKEF